MPKTKLEHAFHFAEGIRQSVFELGMIYGAGEMHVVSISVGVSTAAATWADQVRARSSKRLTPRFMPQGRLTVAVPGLTRL